MTKLYYENPYVREFTAEIINILEKDNKYHIELDKTYFYPGDENQPNDIGYINSADVLYVYEQDSKIYHVVEVKPLKIHKVKCIINWTKRYDYMQQHLGQHILSASFTELFNANTLNIHLNDNYSYIDIDKIIGIGEIKKVEQMSNKIIFDNINVEILYPTNAELKKLSFKKSHNKKDEKIRIAKIGDVDLSLCNGIHPNSTIEVQLIKINFFEKRVKGMRVHFICGNRAVSDYFLKSTNIEKMCTAIKCTENDLLDKVETLAKDLNNAISEKNTLKTQIAEYEVQNILNSSENINDVKIIKSIYDNVNLKYINLLGTKLVSHPKVIVLFGVISEDKAQLMFMCSKDLNVISMNSLLKDAITLIDGNGGGNNFSAQGGGKNNNNLHSSIEYAYNKVKDSLIFSSQN
ncbi:alanyl-tRNA editing protein [Clostridium lundense]|uniref:alanyl-tRNA editing protein n=1 Tax=Clostridium lundense TaxID=319475 RepID=UPI000489E6A3|nr:DHHA1 domain-containing protein [Clostridium lundense]